MIIKAQHKDTPDNAHDLGLLTKEKTKVKRPSMYKVILLNDDYTPMDFVIHILQVFFNKQRQEATRITMDIHNKGLGICGVYPREIAESKVDQVMSCCRENEHPLQCTLEKE